MSIYMFRLFLLFTFASVGFAQETMLRQVTDPATNTHVEVLALFSKLPAYGYMPVQVNVANNLPQPQKITLSFHQSNGYQDNSICKSQYRFEIPTGKTLRTTIIVPLILNTMSYGSQTLSVQLSGTMGAASGSLSQQTNGEAPHVLLSDRLLTKNALSLEQANKQISPLTGVPFGGKFIPADLPDDWRAYVGYDDIFLAEADWDEISPGARNAIVSWVRLGGKLIIYHTGETPHVVNPAGAEPGLGSVKMESAHADFTINPTDACHIVYDSNQSLMSSAMNEYDGSWPLQDSFGSKEFYSGFLLVILLIFAIIVGPVNLFFLAKASKRHRLFFTTPLICILASLAFISIVIFHDGFGGAGVRLVLMETGQNSAYIHQQQFSRSGLISSSPFTIASPCTYTAVPLAASPWVPFSKANPSMVQAYDLQPSDGKLTASGDWFKSRTEAGHILSAIIPNRGRIETTSVGSQLTSSFEFEIDELLYLDGTGWHFAQAVQTGKSFPLANLELSKANELLSQYSSLLTPRGKKQFSELSNRPGHFIAITRHAPGIDTHPGIRWRETRTIITGAVVTP